MKTFRKISAVLLVMGIVVATFFACNKEKEEANTQQTNEEVTRKPIATKNLNTGAFSYNISVESIQKGFNNVLSTKDNPDRYIVESFEIEEDAFSFDTISLSALKVVFLDTELEKANTHWFFGGFIEEIIEGDFKYYYLGEDMMDGNYSYITSGRTNTKLSIQNGSVVSSEIVDGQEYGPLFCWSLSCTEGPKCKDCFKHNPTHSIGGWTCDCSNGYDPDNQIYCQGTLDDGNTISIIAIIVVIVIAAL